MMKLPFFSRKYLEILRDGAARNLERYGTGFAWLDELSPGGSYVRESGYIVDPPPQLPPVSQ